MLKSILMVPVIMGCALVSTVGLMAAIKKFSPDAFINNETAKNTKEEEQSK